MSKLFIIFMLTVMVVSLQALQPESPGLYFSYVSPAFQAEVSAILSLPEAHELLTSIQRDGRISIRLSRNMPDGCEALWCDDERLIAVNDTTCRSRGVRIRSILFELHNASAKAQFGSLDRLAMTGKIAKEAYVEGIERIEHNHVLRTCKLIELGIQRGIFPIDTRWMVMRDFASHYLMQQLTGHSEHVAKNYNDLAPRRSRPFQGVFSSFAPLTSDDKSLLTNYLWMKTAMIEGSDKEKQEAERFIQREKEQLKSYVNPRLNLRHQRFLDIVFSKTDIQPVSRKILCSTNGVKAAPAPSTPARNKPQACLGPPNSALYR